MSKRKSFLLKAPLILGTLFSLVLFFIRVHIASAHEVYVLDQSEIATALRAPRPDFIGTIMNNLGQFVRWGALIFVLLVAAFFISFNKRVRSFFAPFLILLKKWAPALSQFVLGLAITASGYFHSLFGIELSFHNVFGNLEQAMAWIFMVLGIMLMIGIFPRVAGIFLSLIFVFASFKIGVYMLTYLLYLGEALTLFLFGGAYSIHSHRLVSSTLSKRLPESLHNYKFLLIRITFGISLIYASLYAKFIHAALALETVSKYSLTNYFHFDPVFLVLGALLIEILVGACFAFGFLIRFAAIFFLTMLTMSLVFFGETVWPHLILIGTAVVMFMHGYDRYTLMSAIQRDKDLEPVL